MDPTVDEVFRYPVERHIDDRVDLPAGGDSRDERVIRISLQESFVDLRRARLRGACNGDAAIFYRLGKAIGLHELRPRPGVAPHFLKRLIAHLYQLGPYLLDALGRDSDAAASH